MQRERAEPAVGSISQPRTEAAHTARSLLVPAPSDVGGSITDNGGVGAFLLCS